MKIFLLLLLSTIIHLDAYHLDKMSLEEKIGQLLMVHFHGEVVNEEAKTLITEVKVGGIIYYNWSNGLHSPQQVQALSSGLQELVKKTRHAIPLLIAADQEGGLVARLSHGFTIFPGNQALGETNDPELAKQAAKIMGDELKAVGINMNLAPVVDVNTNPYNPVIGIRAFGDHPEKVVMFGEKALEGYKQSRIIATLKHFPGHGDVSIDSHHALPIIHKSMAELKQVELVPFAKLALQADVIMTAHLLVPAFDQENCSTLSKKTLDYLRNEIGFTGVIIADSLVMEGVLKECQNIDEAAIRALNAGCDILLLGGKQLIGGGAKDLELNIDDIKRIHTSIVQAVKMGHVTEERIDQALEKVLALKQLYLDSKSQQCLDDLLQKVNSAEHQKVAKKIAALALQKKIKNIEEIPNLAQKNVLIVAPHLLNDSLNQSGLSKIGKNTQTCTIDLNPSNEEIEPILRYIKDEDALIICTYNAWKNPHQKSLIDSLINTGKFTILLVTRDPTDASLFLNADIVYKTFSPTTPAFQAVYDQYISNTID